MLRHLKFNMHFAFKDYNVEHYTLYNMHPTVLSV